MFNVASNPVVPQPDALAALDRLLQISREEGVRLLIPLIAYKSAVRGDPSTYGPDFWVVGSEANLKFKNMLVQLIGRTNPLTGIRYRDDPAIFGWHTGNELVIGDDPDRRRWLHDIAAYIKQLDPNHLLIDGRNKPNDIHQRYDEFANDPNLDGVSYHTYVNLPEADTVTGTLRLIRDQVRNKKPLLITEVAMYTSPETLKRLLEEILVDGTAGAQWWGLRFHNRDGGYYKHSDRGSQFEDLNWPGFSDPDNYLPEIARERELLDILTDYAGRISGRTIPPVVPPAPPTLLPADDIGHLSWQGSTGALHYEIQRATNENGPWVVLDRDIQVNLLVYTSLYSDRTAELGRNYFYRVIAHNAAGSSRPSNIVGPILADRLWMIDDLFDLSRVDPASTNIAVKKAYAHDEFLEDVAVAHRGNAAQPTSLIYRLPGPIANVSLTVFKAEKPLEFYVHTGSGSRVPVTFDVTPYDDGKRARYRKTFPETSGDTLEIVLSAEADPKQAIGRVEISYRLRQ
jgi:hypothetical protein